MFKLTIVPIIINIFCCHAAAAVGAGLMGKSKSFLLQDNVEKKSAILKNIFGFHLLSMIIIKIRSVSK